MWLALALAILALALASQRLRRAAEVQGFHRIDPSRVDLGPGLAEAGLPHEWSARVANALARLGELSSLDEDLIERVRGELAALAFVAEVGPARVLWPDGVTVDVRFRVPVACVQSGPDFVPVARDGVILPGYWPAPPDFGLGLLPVLGPNDGSFDEALAGDVLIEDRHLDALSIAVSLREHLTPLEIDRLGRCLIDAEASPFASVDEPGAFLALDEGRRVLWGRVPRSAPPGELDEGTKWSHVLDALGYLEGPDASDWSFVDVRWDRATLGAR